MAAPVDANPPSLPDSLPDYPQMIMAAIEALDEKEGSSKAAISDYTESNYTNLPANHATVVSDHLEKMKKTGQLIYAKGNYRKADAGAPPKRGRGRPPKPKTSPPPSTGPPRPRGRPPKPRDEAAPAAPAASASGVKRGRGRTPKKDKADEPPAPAPAPIGTDSGVKRGRGRPPKEKPAAQPASAAVGA